MADSQNERYKGRKSFVPLENNPEVFTSLTHHLGGTSDLAFYDVYDLDESSLAHIPRPAHALIFTCPAEVYFRARRAEPKLEYDGAGPDEPVVWYRQTIRHACGMIGLLHALSNGSARAHIEPDSLVDDLIKRGEPLRPEARAQILYDSASLEAAHSAAAQTGDTVAPPAEDESENHFITFVKNKDGRLWELEGGWGGPIERGHLKEDEDVLCEKALDLGVRKLMSAAEGIVGFSLVALAPKA